MSHGRAFEQWRFYDTWTILVVCAVTGVLALAFRFFCLLYEIVYGKRCTNRSKKRASPGTKGGEHFILAASFNATGSSHPFHCYLLKTFNLFESNSQLKIFQWYFCCVFRSTPCLQFSIVNEEREKETHNVLLRSIHAFFMRSAFTTELSHELIEMELWAKHMVSNKFDFIELKLEMSIFTMRIFAKKGKHFQLQRMLCSICVWIFNAIFECRFDHFSQRWADTVNSFQELR